MTSIVILTGIVILTVGVSQPLSEKVMSERYAALNVSVTVEADSPAPTSFSSVFRKDYSVNLRFYEINPKYIDYLSAFEPHFFHNKRPRQQWIYLKHFIKAETLFAKEYICVCAGTAKKTLLPAGKGMNFATKGARTNIMSTNQEVHKKDD